MHQLLSKFFVALLALSFIFTPGAALAGDGILGKLEGDLADSGVPTDGSFADYILAIVQFLLGLIAVLALGALVWGGIMYVVSLGDESRTSKAKKIILYAIVGLLVAGVSFLVIATIQGIFI